MTDLRRLTVSLTKHGAHKIARVLSRFPAKDALSSLNGAVPDVYIESAQARKNLSVLPDGSVPSIWEDVRALGSDAIDALVLVGIIFSHHELIETVARAPISASGAKRVDRAAFNNQKSYTNFSHIVDQLGFATTVSLNSFEIDLRPMLSSASLGPLAARLLELKLRAANWDGANSLEAEIASHHFSSVFGVDAAKLTNWLSGGGSQAIASPMIAKDERFFSEPDDVASVGTFTFRPGHARRAAEPVSRAASSRTQVNQLHNEIQNRLYDFLCNTIGSSAVGTENATGSGTAIDLVTATSEEGCTFYEIKTADSVRACIRQAIPQLLEYAYWPSADRAARLIVVSHHRPTREAMMYLRSLRDKFGIPIYYQQFSLSKGVLMRMC